MFALFLLFYGFPLIFICSAPSFVLPSISGASSQMPLLFSLTLFSSLHRSLASFPRSLALSLLPSSLPSLLPSFVSRAWTAFLHLLVLAFVPQSLVDEKAARSNSQKSIQRQPRGRELRTNKLTRTKEVIGARNLAVGS